MEIFQIYGRWIKYERDDREYTSVNNFAIFLGRRSAWSSDSIYHSLSYFYMKKKQVKLSFDKWLKKKEKERVSQIVPRRASCAMLSHFEIL